MAKEGGQITSERYSDLTKNSLYPADEMATNKIVSQKVVRRKMNMLEQDEDLRKVIKPVKSWAIRGNSFMRSLTVGGGNEYQMYEPDNL